jgi:hypothetical protein
VNAAAPERSRLCATSGGHRTKPSLILGRVVVGNALLGSLLAILLIGFVLIRMRR